MFTIIYNLHAFVYKCIHNVNSCKLTHQSIHKFTN
nr:MAG TPA: hypothetical protein [Caudoviricetes sp.]